MIMMYGWIRYLSIEEDFMKSRYYVEFDVESAYSDFISKSVILLGAEIEASFKKLCELINEDEKRGSISDYKKIVLKELPNIGEFKSILRDDKRHEYFPFRDWGMGSLSWWDIYGRTKHDLFVKREATLDVAMNMLSAYQLLIFLIAAYEKSDDDNRLAYTMLEVPRLLRPDVDMDIAQQDDDEGLLSYTFSASKLKEKLGKTT